MNGQITIHDVERLDIGRANLVCEAVQKIQSMETTLVMNNQGDVYNVGQAGAVGKYARSDNNTFVQSEQKQTLANAAEEIQNLLKQLEQVYPNATVTDKIAYVNDETTPGFKRRVVGALQAGSEAAIEEFLDNPYVNVVKAIVKGWIKPE
jgi:tRNA C32,U32 (ribose-2'-O)-methylase TrmJ